MFTIAEVGLALLFCTPGREDGAAVILPPLLVAVPLSPFARVAGIGGGSSGLMREE